MKGTFFLYLRDDAMSTVLLTLVLTISLYFPQAAEGAKLEPLVMDHKRIQVEIVSVNESSAGTKKKKFRIVLLCDTQEKRARGLQGFRPLLRGEAALFVFEKPEAAVFWMGSVDFPIDIVFVDQEGRVISVYRDCRPGSRELYPSGAPVKWVIETSAGSNIRKGDLVKIINVK